MADGEYVSVWYMPVIKIGDDRNIQTGGKVFDTGVYVAVKAVYHNAIGEFANNYSVEEGKVFLLL